MDSLGPMDPGILAEAAALSERLTQEDEQQRPGPEDSDTCRICRGEGSPTEPLFYPCKCSGSIKFVHQDCLMEWLSHSQKKYCELCKTPFRFTKLYHPQMPRTIPTAVFLKKALWHVLVHLMTWLRALLVISVWLICLPWAMRSGWRFLFWLADAGWARDRAFAASLLENPTPSRQSFTSGLLSNITQTAQIPAFFSHFLKLTEILPTFALLKFLFNGLASPFLASEIPHSVDVHDGLNSTDTSWRDYPDNASLLSEIPFLVNFSPYPAFNNVVIHVLEGLCITIGVVVAFILVFLIREWVVQQQPALDLAAANDMNNALAQAGGQAQDQQNHQEAELEAVAQQNVHIDGIPQVDQAIDGSVPILPSQIPEASSQALDSTHVRSEDPRLGIVGKPYVRSQREYALIHVLRWDPVEWTNSAIHRMTTSERDSLDRFAILSEQEELLDTLLATQADSSESDHKDEVEFRHRHIVSLLDDLFSTSVFESIIRERRDEQSTDAADTVVPHQSGSSGHLADKSNHSVDNEDVEGNDRFESTSQRADYQGNSHDNWHVLEDASDGSTSSRNPTPESIPLESEHTEPVDLTRAEQHANATLPDDAENIELQPAQVTSNQAGGEDTVNAGAHIEIESEKLGILHRAFDWFWGDVPPPTDADLELQAGEDDDHIVEDIEQEAPFVALPGALPIDMQPAQANPNVINDGAAQVQIQDPEVAAAAAEAGIDVDQEAIEDAEDLEGILELIGMQGPVVQLFQNVIFSAVLVMTSILIAVFVPYLWGKLVLLCLATPRLFIQIPITMALQFANVVADVIITVSCTFMFSVIWFYQQLTQTTVLEDTVSYAGHMVTQSWPRLQHVGMYVLATHESNDLLDASMLSHYALNELRIRNRENLGLLTGLLMELSQAITTGGVFETAWKATKQARPFLFGLIGAAYQSLQSLSRDSIAEFLIDAPGIGPAELDLQLAYWSPGDRAIAVMAGYGFVAVLGALYLAQLAPLTTAGSWRRIENHVIEFLTQAGGVLKVIFIIGIEMIVFPLFCGFLLDLALLPLFEDASTVTRLKFTLTAPWTSGFVHWFVGTCYMFHFALFVSMCRKIMRKGVLYFIRDPDDPTFHPVRDVLERSVATQLRKIAFSAIVYGALITVCLGGVVWGLWTVGSAYNVLPIHWSSTESALEFPLDILFYSFLTPVVLRAAKPSDALHEMYKHWFHCCARALRLSSFLFGEEHEDEQGHSDGMTWLHRAISSPSTPDDFPNIEENGEVSPAPAPTSEGPPASGRYVRAPNSDQLRPPKGGPVFVELNADKKRLDGLPDLPATDPSSTMTAIVYIPPFFRIRVGLFVAAIWLYAAFTGVSITIGPLLLGRALIKSFMPEHAKVNDIYAFSLGIYIFGAVIWLALNLRDLYSKGRDAILANFTISAISNRLSIIKAHALQTASILYVYGTAAFILPFLFAVLVELYVLLPFHIFFGPPGEQRHVVNLVQDWTLGFLYARIGARILQWNGGAGARSADVLARAFRAVTRDGYWHPDAKLATRYFVLPFVILFSVAAMAPFLAAGVVNRVFFAKASQLVKVQVIRLAYPVLLGSGLAIWLWVILLKAVRRWKSVVRDEVYLIGERLHNFGERKAKGRAVLTAKERGAIQVPIEA